MISHPWQPIADLPDDWEAFARPDLDEMLRLWNEERQHLADPGRAVALQERLANLWAIETGVIERLYTIDRGTTESLVELGLGAIEQFSTTGRLTQNAARLIEDQRAALDFVFAYIKDDRPLTLSYIREMHHLLMQHQTHIEAVNQFGDRFQAEVVRGAWKTHPNNPTTVDGSLHEYAPPHLVQDEMDQLIRMHRRHLNIGVRPEVEAAWLHHRFAQIHPFQDGNGRVARALATMIFLKAGFVPLVIRDDDHRERYLDALEIADRGDLGPLVSLFANVVSADLNDAIRFVRLMHGRGIRDIAAAAADAAKRRAEQPEWDVRAVTNNYRQISMHRLISAMNEIDEVFDPALKGVPSKRLSDVILSGTGSLREKGKAGRSHRRWRQHIESTARIFEYEPDLSQHREWVQLQLPDAGTTSYRWSVVISFHHKALRADSMAAILFLTTSSDRSSRQSDDDGPLILGSQREFSFGRGHPQDYRFRLWLEDALNSALEEWQARI